MDPVGQILGAKCITAIVLGVIAHLSPSMHWCNSQVYYPLTEVTSWVMSNV